jgi:hypothetical protein
MEENMHARIAMMLALGLLATAGAHGAVVQTLSNPVADGAINTTGGNNDRSDWAAVTPYAADAYEAASSDWAQVSMAHDTSNFYLRYAMNSTTNGGFLDTNQRAFFDVNQSRSSGYQGGGGQLSVGAEYMLEGTALYAFTGGASQTAWAWNWVGALSYDDYPTHDHELTLPMGSVGTPVAFDFVLFASGSPEDYYPGTGNAAGDGGYFTYTTAAVPEPASIGLLSLGAVAAMRRRRDR